MKQTTKPARKDSNKPIRPVNTTPIAGAAGDGTSPSPNPASPYGQPVTGQPAPGSQPNS